MLTYSLQILFNLVNIFFWENVEYEFVAKYENSIEKRKDSDRKKKRIKEEKRENQTKRFLIQLHSSETYEHPSIRRRTHFHIPQTMHLQHRITLS